MKDRLKQRRYVILDRDGTIIVERNYLIDPNQVELLPGAASAIRCLRNLGLGLIIATNQAAIGRGILDLTNLEAIHARLETLLAAQGAELDGIYFCPHKPEDHCTCRKPLPGMIESASQKMHFDPSSCFVIGDKPCDIELGHNIGAMTFLTRTGYGAQVEVNRETTPDFIVDDLEEAAYIIEQILDKQG